MAAPNKQTNSHKVLLLLRLHEFCCFFLLGNGGAWQIKKPLNLSVNISKRLLKIVVSYLTNLIFFINININFSPSHIYLEKVPHFSSRIFVNIIQVIHT